jgi:hypothetical protein
VHRVNQGFDWRSGARVRSGPSTDINRITLAPFRGNFIGFKLKSDRQSQDRTALLLDPRLIVVAARDNIGRTQGDLPRSSL